MSDPPESQATIPFQDRLKFLLAFTHEIGAPINTLCVALAIEGASSNLLEQAKSIADSLTSIRAECGTAAKEDDKSAELTYRALVGKLESLAQDMATLAELVNKTGTFPPDAISQKCARELHEALSYYRLLDPKTFVVPKE